MSDSIGRKSPQRKRKSVVPSTVVAAATAGVTGITLAWAVGTSPTPDSSAVAAAKVSNQIAADRIALSHLQQTVADTRGQLTALGGVNIPAPTQGGKPVAPGTPGTTAVTGTPGTTAGGVAAGSVAHSDTSGTTGSNTGSGPATSISASGGSSAGAPAPASAPAPAPTPTSPPATSPPPTSPPPTRPPPPVTTTTRASAA